MEDRVIIVSSDSHAGMPKELWPEYLPKQFHELLPQLHQDNDEIYPTAIYCIGAKGAADGAQVTGAPGGRTATTGTVSTTRCSGWPTWTARASPPS